MCVRECECDDAVFGTLGQFNSASEPINLLDLKQVYVTFLKLNEIKFLYLAHAAHVFHDSHKNIRCIDQKKKYTLRFFSSCNEIALLL